jgi:hypothetical protein
VSDFQSSASWQGRQFAQQCDFLLSSAGFDLRGRYVHADLGIEIDQVAVTSRGVVVWAEYKGSFQGLRPGLVRTDTVKKAIANGALLQAIQPHPPYLLLTSHLPSKGAALTMLEVAKRLGYFHDVICVNDPNDVRRLSEL